MWMRRVVRPVLIDVDDGWDLREEAPRRAWTAAIGPTAVASYLRLREAARLHDTVLRPQHLEILLREHLVAHHRRTVLVPSRVPPVSLERLRRSTAGRKLLKP